MAILWTRRISDERGRYGVSARHRLTAGLALAALIVGLAAGPTGATLDGLTEAKLVVVNDPTSQSLGRAVAVSGDAIAVSAVRRYEETAGVVHVHRSRQGGFARIELTVPDGSTAPGFGHSLAVSDELVVVGTFDPGAVQVYELDDLEGVTGTLVHPSGGTGAGLAHSVAVSGTTVVVGVTSSTDDGGPDAGSTYIYTPDGLGGYDGTELVASDAAAGDFFGQAVAISGDTIVLAAPGSGHAGANSGAAYVFEPDGLGGYDETKLTASDAAPADNFGHAVAISGDTIVIGAPFDDDAGTRSGSAYVYTPDGLGGYDETKLTASDAAPGDNFAKSVAVDGDTIVIGAPGSDHAGANSGAAYAFTPDGIGGYDETKLTASDAAPVDNFGESVAVAGDTIVIGAPRDDDAAEDSGSAYIYRPARPSIACPSDTTSTPFEDLDTASASHRDDISCVHELGLTTGTTPTTYSPLDTVTRQQMASLLARLYHVITGETAPVDDVPFTDMDEASISHRDDIARVYGLGITTGTSPTTYSPLDTLTRQQMASLLARLYHAATGTTAPVVPVPYVDLDDASITHHADIARIHHLGITTGTSPTTYSPLDTVTRQQMASLLARLHHAATR